MDEENQSSVSNVVVAGGAFDKDDAAAVDASFADYCARQRKKKKKDENEVDKMMFENLASQVLLREDRGQLMGKKTKFSMPLNLSHRCCSDGPQKKTLPDENNGCFNDEPEEPKRQVDEHDCCRRPGPLPASVHSV